MHINTYRKVQFNPLNPHSDDILIEDIAHAQSLMTRANGHFPEFYSVAQHSIACAREALARNYSHRIALACLLHDGSEAYLSDITRPVKHQLEEYRQIEKKMQDTIYQKFLGTPPSPEENQKIKDIDDTCLYYEFYHYMDIRLMDNAPLCHSTLHFETIPFQESEQQFLDLFSSLYRNNLL